MHRAIVGTAALIVAACSHASTAPSAEDPLAPPPAGSGMQFRMVSTLAAGQEIERCAFFSAPPEGLWISHEDVRYTPGSHHVLLFRTPYTAVPTKTDRGEPIDTSGVFDCANGPNADWTTTAIVGGAQSRDAPPMIDLPPGVALRIDPGTVLLMNTHYLNASAQPVVSDARINVYTVPKEQVTQEAGIIFFYQGVIRVPPEARASARARCPIPRDVELVNAQSHMHRRGVGYVADLIGPDGHAQRLYESADWENVPVTRWSPARPIAAGSQIDFRCDYQNTEDRLILQGPTTKDEMCMFVGVYYPRDADVETCSTGGGWQGYMSAVTYVGTGTATCQATMTCLRGARPLAQDHGDSAYQCITSSCPAAAVPLHDVMACNAAAKGGACKDACSQATTAGPQGCSDCVQKACAASIDACDRATCAGGPLDTMQ